MVYSFYDTKSWHICGGFQEFTSYTFYSNLLSAPSMHRQYSTVTNSTHMSNEACVTLASDRKIQEFNCV